MRSVFKEVAMDSRENHSQKVAQVARQIGAELRKQARKSWQGVRTAERNEGNRHVWRFRSAADGSERFLHVAKSEMITGDDAAANLLEQLKAGGWIDRLSRGPETALLLSKAGLQAYPLN
jgi:hypothetical protein